MSKPENLVGKRIDQFSLEAFIASGAMGMVFKAFDSVLARTVALKLIPKQQGEDSPDTRDSTREEARKRLIQEAKAAGKLAQPNIVTIHSYGDTAEFQYICMEYISGQTLAQVLKERGKIPADEAVPIFEQILLALEAADLEGIVHRDIKPSNIMITKNGLVKVMDFGIAKLPSLSMTVTGMVLGTPYYMSPEQISGKKVDIRSDIFSLGAVLYEVLTGEKPFEGESTASLTYKIIQEDPIPPNAINRLVPDPLAAMVIKALSKDPAGRYKNPSEMLCDLRKLSTVAREPDDKETMVSGRFVTAVPADRVAGVRVETVTASVSPAGTGAGARVGDSPADRPPSGMHVDKIGRMRDASQQSGMEAREVSPKGVASREVGRKKVTRSKSARVAVILIVIIVGGLFAMNRMNRKNPQNTPEKPPQTPATLQEATGPEPSTQPADSQPKPMAQSLPFQAEKLFASDPDRAQSLLEEALTREPNNYACSLSLARLLSHKKEYAASIDEYRHALRLDNRAPEVHYELGILCQGQGEYDLAIESFENALMLSPKDRDEVLVNLGFCHFKKGDYRQARLLFQQSLDLNPDSVAAKAFMASLPTPGAQTAASALTDMQPLAAQSPTTPSPAAKFSASQRPAAGPSTTQPFPSKLPASLPSVTKPPNAQQSASAPAAMPPHPPQEAQGVSPVGGLWDYSITIQGGQIVTGQISIDAKGDHLQMIATASYLMRGQDGFMHQFQEKDYFSGALQGQNLAARCDKADFLMDGRPAPAPGLPLQLNLVLNADGHAMQGYVSNRQGVSAPLYVKKR